MVQSPVLRDLERRIAEFTHLPVENGESFYLLRYNVGEKYVPHMDYFGGPSFSPSPYILSSSPPSLLHSFMFSSCNFLLLSVS